ncbi:MAG: hypothetical protein KDG50_15030 [Chromatiales bacterium]|nr:hypothetical protein [Chromatiales bacterium]
MALKNSTAPAQSFVVLQESLAGARLDANDPSALTPHKVYYIGSDDLLSGKGLGAAQLSAWRYVFRGEDNQTHVAEIGVDEDNATHSFHLINRGSHVDNFVALYEQIHEHDAVVEKDYEVNLLRAPACYVIAVWFKGVGHDHDLFVPLAPVHSNFEAGRHYEAMEFMGLLEKTAREMAGGAPEPRRDDLTKIEGIGPKISALLQTAGVSSYADLSNADPSRLRDVLLGGGAAFNVADPATWAEQAALAAAGRWDELRELQDKLVAGRRR